MQLSPDFVGAINLVEVEFAKVPKVAQSARAFLDLFNKSVPTDDETLRRHEVERDMRLTQMLDAMAKSLGLSIEQLDILSGGYAPIGWFNVENEQRAIRHLLGDLLMGKKTLPVRVVSEDETPPSEQAEATNVIPARRPDASSR